ncbi:phosphoribosylaminoimidazolecarboxamide formyltransferase / IMP cyclohydrolase [Ferrithrix thermotolerans DSM 19514]|uniref:Bifunctional purine biosynthesis protein PurH n=1 Tax=Ferrithrix thermotolerans DSM 19514 TaxID=1121881 RepID=A0A1M4SWL9_9ACTN|nr:bifunctional phosphoribosylaminoimidazolecarboxamide formyltransferase/IMP cyclohydrolase [Ferrithrix thermotolerans]SHE36585.1 phosphoribosylaminoimidazolecarboxamide formyltransferase / IMP cyclohydrolase [Ferrithrix thermotolerans DSM 19514]
MRALISVYDKTGLLDFAQALQTLGVEIVASGGTASELEKNGVQHQKVEDLTGFAELLDGRVKTLHPKVHGAILADRSKESHLKDLSFLGVDPIDIVVCNLYPFSSNPSVELIDIGGPAMLRAAAKNFAYVAAVVDPSDYPAVLEELGRDRAVSFRTRKYLAHKVFDHTSRYDYLVASWLQENADDRPLASDFNFSFQKELKYGENPHQRGYLYQDEGDSVWKDPKWILGPEPSYLNIFDSDAAWTLVNSVDGDNAVVIVKHANPCGVAVANSLVEAYEKAFDCDPISAFGGVVAFKGEVDADLAEAILSRPKADVLIAPSYSEAALEVLSSKRKNTRVVALDRPRKRRWSFRSVGGSLLVQEIDSVESVERLISVTSRQLLDNEIENLDLAWKVCAATSSNAIVVVNDKAAVGIGCGQQNRVDSARLAVARAGEAAKGAVAASDAFFPFPDGLETLASAGVSVVIAPSGSIRDQDIAARAEELGISFIFAANRHFRH